MALAEQYARELWRIMSDHRNWASFFEEEIATTFAITLDVREEKSREEQISRLLHLPLDQAFLIIVESVPALNNDDWMDFQHRLVRRIPSDEQAKTLLKMARLMVEAENEIRGILSLHNIPEAVEIITSMSQTRGHVEQFTLMACLHYLAKTDPKASAIWGYVCL